MPSLTIENYLKTIYQVCVRQDNAPASTGCLAQKLGVAPGTVTSMLKTLSDGGMAEYTPYGGARLTDVGRRLALRVLRRHRLIELFLVTTLKLSWDEVHDEAENMEHAVSDLLIDRIDEFLGHPDRDPHGDPIPAADGTLRATDSRRLADLGAGDDFQLVRVLEQSARFLRHLSQQGLQLGVVGQVVSEADEAGVMMVEVDQQQVPLAESAAEKLLVQPPSP